MKQKNRKMQEKTENGTKNLYNKEPLFAQICLTFS